MRRSLLQGALGEALTLTINERLKKVDYAQLVEPFKLRNETDGAWRCEFWGKIVRSAITAVWATGDCELRAMVDKTVQDILTCQSADGCISSYPPDKQLDAWDVWGRKYVLLALERYYEMLNPDPRILQCCCAMTDHLMTQIGSGENQKTILQCGRHTGMAASSILGAVVALWRLSGKEKYRDFARAIIDSGCSATGNIFAGAAAGIVPAALGNGKAYEMTSCFQGVAELLLAEGKTDLPTQTMLMRYYQSVLEREIFVTGVGGAKDACGEYWYDGALRQTRSDCGGLGETCVAATWIRFCMRMLELTGDCRIADELEKSLYNTILGAMAPDGSHWMHVNPTPLTGGSKICAVDQIGNIFKTPFGGNDCCRAQGPEGLSVAARVAVMENRGRVCVNFYEPLTSGNILISGNYPWENRAVIRFTAPEEYTLALRTPEFLRSVKLNGKALDFTVGKYLEINRCWSEKDEIILEFEFTIKVLTAPGDPNYVALKRGPIVLAKDSRGIVPDAKIHEVWHGINLCEYAAAGNLMNPENTLAVWLRK
ncbi:MAG: glycoside hydrolase family 127 protein [Lentisphaeria bacterium]|nr:glycoside hydrolase family 127 protein [Lentisphaeria bacterium]